MPSGPEWFIVLVVVLVIFGGSQLPKLAKNLGKAQKEFKDGLAEGQADTTAQAGRPDRGEPPRTDDPHRLRDRPTPERRPSSGDAVAGRQSAVDGEPAALEDAPALALAAPAPHAVVDAVLEGVLQARLGRPGSRRRSCAPCRRRPRRWGRTSPAGRAGSCPSAIHAVAVSSVAECRLPSVRSPSLLLPVGRDGPTSMSTSDDVRRCPTVPVLGKRSVKIRPSAAASHNCNIAAAAAAGHR